MLISRAREHSVAIIRTRLLVIGCALGAVACADRGTPAADAGATWTSVRSMAGDTVVMRSSGGLPDSGTHALTELWRIGDVDGLDSTVTFGRISGFAVRADNQVAVFDAALTTLRLYDANGRYVKTLGRKGAGPGEYSQANGVAYLPDGRLALWDPPTSRITLYNTDTTTTDSWQPPVTGMFMNNAMAAHTAHALAVRAPLRDTSEQEARVMMNSRTAYFLYDATGTIADTVIAPPPAVERPMATAATETMVTAYAIPYTESSMSQMLSDGRLVNGTSNAYRLNVTGQAAPLRIEVRANRVPVERSEASEQRARVEWQLQRTDPKWSWTLDDIPSEKPYFNAIFPTNDGRMWLSVATPSERIPESERAAPSAPSPNGRPARPQLTWREPNRYDVFDTDGALLGRIAMPPRSTLLAVQGDLAWGTVTDDLDVPYLVQWRVSPSWTAATGAR